MIGFDLSDITNVYVGSTPQSAIYLGSLLVWPKSHTSEYLTFELIEPSQFAVVQLDTIDLTNYNISYSTDNGSTWTNVMTQSGVTPTFPAGARVLWKGNLSQLPEHPGLGVMAFDNELYVNVSGRYRVSGNPSSLYFGDSFASTNTTYHAMYANLFMNNHYLVSATNLTIEGMNSHYCLGMFSGCTALTGVPELPATTLSYNCYRSMFTGCTSLTTAPALPATTLDHTCYMSMFAGCTSLTTAPALPATTLPAECYWEMFSGCTALTSAPTLSATTFSGRGQYAYMFQGCTSLTTPPALPATTLTAQCYEGMFQGCTSLTSTPQFVYNPTLASECYKQMFYGCSSLVTAYDLGLLSSAERCCYKMFENCTSLATAPALAAPILAEECYRDMFKGCSSLSSITCLATDISATNCTAGWVYGVAPVGIFYKVYGMQDWVIDTDYGIPVGWTLQNTDYSPNEYLTFETLESAAFTFNYNLNHSDPSVNPIYYSVDDGATWNAMNISIPTQPANTRILLKSDWLSRGASGNPGTFIATGRFNVTGNIMSLLGGDNFANITTVGASEFRELFKDCINLVDARSLKLPVTTLTDSCYRSMFYGCTSLIYAPALPATTLANNCYRAMLSGCTSLTSAPELLAVTLSDYCCSYMFENCSSLINVQSNYLSSTTLTSGCYSNMFKGCTSLTTAPELPATTLVQSCYRNMFDGCTLLSSVICLATSINATYATANWLNGVAASGTFTKAASMTRWSTGASGIPSGWTVQDAS